MYIFADSTYPREGTETAQIRLYKVTFAIQLIPARGRKLRKAIYTFSHSWIQLIPARGRKHAVVGGTFSAYVDSTYPREGNETSHY